MSTQFRFRHLAILMPALLALAAPVPAANFLEFFFGDPGDQASTTLDDRLVIKPIFWDDDDIEYFLFDPFPQINTNTFNGVLPFGSNMDLDGDNVGDIFDRDVLEALEDALKEWNDGPFSNFTFNTAPQFLSTTINNGGQQLADIRLDGFNLVNFRSGNLVLTDDALALTAVFFFEREFDVVDEFNVPVDEIESIDEDIEIDFNEDGFVDFAIQPKTFEQGELIEADIMFTDTPPTVTNNPNDEREWWFLWPNDPDDVPDQHENLVPGSADIHAIMFHELGHAHGLGHTWIQDATMAPVLRGRAENFPTNPFKVRTGHFDDFLAQGFLYGEQFGSSRGEVTGAVFDGAHDPDDDTTPDRFVALSPVFVGVPAEVGAPSLDIDPLGPEEEHPDVVESTLGRMRMIAQVLTGRDSTFAIDEGGIDDLEPVLGPGDAGITFFPEAPESEVESMYRFAGLPARSDYVIYIDQAFTTTTGAVDEDVTEDIAINVPQIEFDGMGVETFPAEFFGGSGRPNVPDTATGDVASIPNFVTVNAGEITENIDVTTNIDDGDATPTPTPPPGSEELRFVRQEGAFPPSDSIVIGGDMGDIDRDGFLDVVTAVFSEGTNTTNIVNRVYLNRPVDPNDPSKGRKFVDVTFGPDGIPGTTDDLLPPDTDRSRDAKLVDVDNDGDLDLFVSNASNGGPQAGGGFNRLYMNFAIQRNFTDPSQPPLVLPPGQFVFGDISEGVLPGLLNRGWQLNGENEFFPPQNTDFPFPARDDSTRAVFGDIDSDGDQDLIIGLLVGMPDGWEPIDPETGQELDFPVLGPQAGTVAAVDADPNNPPDELADSLWDPTADPFSQPFALLFAERVLINVSGEEFDALVGTDENGNRLFPGFRFVDKTLGDDFVFGDPTLENLVEVMEEPEDPENPLPEDEEPPLVAVDEVMDEILFANPNIDRIPPTFPVLALFDDDGAVASLIATPMSWNSFEPRLAAYDRDAALDLYSVRGFQDDIISFGGQSTTRGAQSGFHNNIDINGDGIPDGFFHQTNYGLDRAARRGSDLFPLRPFEVPGRGLVLTYEMSPLPTAIPDGVTGDVTDPAAEVDLWSLVDQGAFTSVIGDWEYRDAPKPIAFNDSDFGPPTYYVPLDTENIGAQIAGSRRGQTNLVTGIGVSFFPSDEGVQGFFLEPPGPAYLAPTLDVLPQISDDDRESRAMAAADFDNDGDLDFVVATSLQFGFTTTGGTRLPDTTVPNLLFLNANTFAEDAPNPVQFSNASFLLQPNEPKAAFAALTGDTDNDGDEDIVFLNAQNNHDLFVNQLKAVGQPFDLLDQDDAPAFSDKTQQFLPPIYTGTVTPPEGFSELSGVTTGVSSADFNNDGLPDIVTAEGGALSFGSFPQLQFNNGPSGNESRDLRVDAVKHFKPIQAPFPPPMIVQPGNSGAITRFNDNGSSDTFLIQGILPPNTFSGFITDDFRGAGIYFDVLTNDLNNDGSPDLFFTRTGDGPSAYLNVDSAIPHVISTVFQINDIFPPVVVPEARFNSLPDPDITIGDGIFLNSVDLSQDLVDINGGIQGGAFTEMLPNRGRLNDPNRDPGASFHLKRQGRRAVAADFDNDGDLDVLIGNGFADSGASNVLLRNDMGPTPEPLVFNSIRVPVFTDVSESALPTEVIDINGIPTSVAVVDDTYDVAAGDFDHDGDIDLVFINEANAVSPGVRYLENTGGGVFVDNGSISGPDFAGRQPRAVVIGDFDNVGESGEDANGNGVLDKGEDANGNGVLDFSDANFNGRRDASWDLFITFVDGPDQILINNSTAPGNFVNQTSSRLSTLPQDPQSRGVRTGDLNLDGHLDIVIAKPRANVIDLPPVQWLLNDGTGVFTDVSHEFLPPRSIRTVEGPIDIQGNAFDVELLDVDTDGDLDVYVGMAGQFADTVPQAGGLNVFYRNNIIGDNFKAEQPGTPQPSGGAQMPVLIDDEPNFGVPGTSLFVLLKGLNFEPNTQVDFGPGITVNGVQFIDATTLRVDITIAPSASLGGREVKATNPSSGQAFVAPLGFFKVSLTQPGPPDNSVDAWHLYDY